MFISGACNLGFILTCNGVKSQPSEVQAIVNLKAPKNSKQMHQFVSAVNFYCRMWRPYVHLLAPITELTKKKIKFNWTKKQTFIMYTNASNYQLSGIISQDQQPIAYYSNNKNKGQLNYDVYLDPKLVLSISSRTLHHRKKGWQKLDSFQQKKHNQTLNTLTPSHAGIQCRTPIHQGEV